MKRSGWLQKEGESQSFLLSLLCLWSLSLISCVSVLLCLLVFVFLKGSPARTGHCEENPFTLCQKEFLPCSRSWATSADRPGLLSLLSLPSLYRCYLGVPWVPQGQVAAPHPFCWHHQSRNRFYKELCELSRVAISVLSCAFASQDGSIWYLKR